MGSVTGIVQKTGEKLGKFVKNKTAMFGLAATMFSAPLFGQSNDHQMRLTLPNDSTTVLQPKTAQTPRVHTPGKDNGFSYFALGAKYNKDALWNDGIQFDWHGSMAPGKDGSFLHRFTQVEAGFTLRNKSRSWSYGFNNGNGTSASGYHYWKPSEVYLKGQIGYKAGIESKRNPNLNSAVIYPHAFIGGSYGLGNSHNLANNLSPYVGAAADILVGQIGMAKEISGDYHRSGPTLAVKVSAGIQHQFKNNSFGNLVAGNIIGPNPGPNKRTSPFASVHLILGL